MPQYTPCWQPLSLQTLTADSRDEAAGCRVPLVGDVTAAWQSRGWSRDTGTCCCCCSPGVAVTSSSTLIGSGSVNGVSLSLHTCIRSDHVTLRRSNRFSESRTVRTAIKQLAYSLAACQAVKTKTVEKTAQKYI